MAGSSLVTRVKIWSDSINDLSKFRIKFFSITETWMLGELIHFCGSPPKLLRSQVLWERTSSLQAPSTCECAEWTHTHTHIRFESVIFTTLRNMNGIIQKKPSSVRWLFFLGWSMETKSNMEYLLAEVFLRRLELYTRFPSVHQD